jgi:transcriptional regulator with XRE-family HTH domain
VDGRLQSAVGLSLKAHRRSRGLSQEAFADVLGVHRTYLGGIERGEHNLTLRSVERIADRIEVDPMALLGTEPPAPPELPSERRGARRGPLSASA